MFYVGFGSRYGWAGGFGKIFGGTYFVSESFRSDIVGITFSTGVYVGLA